MVWFIFRVRICCFFLLRFSSKLRLLIPFGQHPAPTASAVKNAAIVVGAAALRNVWQVVAAVRPWNCVPLAGLVPVVIAHVVLFSKKRRRNASFFL
jgi:hypothetical protein